MHGNRISKRFLSRISQRWRSYADATSGVLMRLAARVLGAGGALDAQAREAGLSYAITGFLRALPFHAARSRIMMPANEMDQAGVAAEPVLQGRMTPNLPVLIGRMVQVARSHHAQIGKTGRRFAGHTSSSTGAGISAAAEPVRLQSIPGFCRIGRIPPAMDHAARNGATPNLEGISG